MSRAGGERPSRPSVAEATLTAYKGIIDDVVANVKADFVQEGVDESVLDELRALWESYLVRSGAVDREKPAGEEAAQPSVPGKPVKLSEDASVLEAVGHGEVKPERPAAASQAPLGPAAREREPTGDSPPTKIPKLDPELASIPQWDGAGDGSEEAGVSSEAAVATASQDPTEDCEVHPELNEDDDLDEIDNAGSGSDEPLPDMVLGQFDKVHRSKARWKVNLRHCVLQLNGRDYLLHKATGEFNF